MVKIVCFGDSITVGQNVSEDKTWRKVLESLLNRKDVEFYNHGVNGDTSRLGLIRFPECMAMRKPDILLVQFGLNDCNYWDTDLGYPRVSEMAFEANMYEFIVRASLFGVKKVLMMSNPPSRKKIRYASHEERNRAYNRIIRKVAGNDTTFVDIHSMLKGREDEVILNDGYNVHLNEFGNKLYAEYLKPYVEEAIKCLNT